MKPQAFFVDSHGQASESLPVTLSPVEFAACNRLFELITVTAVGTPLYRNVKLPV